MAGLFKRDGLEEKELLKIDLAVYQWDEYVTFIFRSLAKVTVSFNCYMATELPAFAKAMTAADEIRSTMKLKKTITNFKVMQNMTMLFDEMGEVEIAISDTLKKLIDYNGRMRMLSLIAADFFKDLVRMEVKELNIVQHFMDHWKGFCVKTFDFTTLPLSGPLPDKMDDEVKKYIALPLAVATSIYAAGQFMKRVIAITGYTLVSELPTLLMSLTMPEQFLTALNMDKSFGKKLPAAAPVLSVKKSPPKELLYVVPSIPKGIKPEFLKPIEFDNLLIRLPGEAIVEAKKGRCRRQRQPKNLIFKQ